MSTANDLLRRALNALHFDLSAKESAKVTKDIHAFLAAEPEADKPVRYMVVNEQGETSFLYTRPEPARKPMTEEEIEETCDTREFDQIQGGMREAFYFGIRFAEKHHNIK